MTRKQKWWAATIGMFIAFILFTVYASPDFRHIVFGAIAGWQIGGWIQGIANHFFGD